MKALVTGSLGFVGRYLRTELEQNGYEVIGIDIREGAQTRKLDLLDAASVVEAVAEIRPNMIIHLAGQANVGLSWKQPQKTMEVNVIGAVNLMEAVRQVDSTIRMVLVGSSDEYGVLGADGALVKETLATKPQTPYAVSKKAQEEMAQVYVKAYGLNICMTRSFNHGGAGQREGFLIPDFAAGIVRVERGQQPCLRVGNLAAKRDFTHVRDVVRAYRLLAEKGQPGEIYNVGSGEPHSVQEILDRLCAMASCRIPVECDPAKMRPSDTPVICCDHSKLTRDTGWMPIYTLENILAETLTYWREQIK